MIKHQILLFLGFLALASALNVTPEKNFFMLPASNGLSTQLFQTRNGIIAYSTDLIRSPDHLVPQYVQIDLETNNVTQILQELPTACGQGPSAFDRLHYHVATYSLVYYCTNNNSILILNQDNYEVQKIVSLSINETFDEVRITTDGYSVAILGLTLQSPSPSHLVKFSLQTQKVVNHIVFDHGFADGEVVTAYDSNGNNMFIIANIFNDGVNIANVYQMTLIGNSYSLTPRVTFNTTTFYVNTLPEFYCVKNFIVTSSGTTLFILHQSGSILAEYSDLDLKEFTIGSYFDLITFWRPTIVSDDGSSDVYASFANYSLYKISAQSQGGFTFENQGIARNISVAVKDQDTNTLLFSFSQNYENFTIIDLAKSEVVYQSVAQFEHFMITDKTYSVIEQLPDLSELLYIFDRQTNQVIQVFPTDRFYYYDQENSVVSRLINYQNGTFQLQQIDLRTGNFYSPLSFSFPPTDFVQLVHATNNENFDAPQLVIHDIGTSDVYLIVSQTFGQVKFINDLPESSFVSYFATNYDTLTSYYFLDMANSQSISVTEYHYDSSQNFFFSNNSNANLFAGYVMPDSDYSVITGTGQLAVIDMALLKQTEYTFSTEWQSIALFQNTNSSNGVNMVLSPVPLWGTPTSSAGILYDGQIQDLPGTTSSTLQAGTAGLCSYWVVNQVGSFGNVQFYNICNNDAISEIFA